MSILKNLRRHRRLVIYRLLDWLVVAILAIGAFMLDRIPAFHRHFSLTDKTIQFPLAPSSTVSTFHLSLISIATPAVILGLVACVIRRSPYDMHQAYLGLGVALSSTSLFVHMFKNFIGRPRPDFIARCQPPEDAADPLLGLSTIDICTQTDLELLYDGMKSFPSGHSAYAFAGMAFVTFYLAGKLQVFDRRGFVFKPLICMLPLIGASLVAISRLTDYRHHWEDVLVGSLLGTILAYFAYRMYYPSLTHRHCMDPFAPPIWYASKSIGDIALLETGERRTENNTSSTESTSH
jgi:diacylglycerol diphosphate phosphatase/phosphatidate phosphatase